MAGFSHSWSLFKASIKVLRQDKGLLVFPLCSALAMLLLAASFIVAPLISAAPGLLLLLCWPLFYFSAFFVVFFFNSALVGAALICLDGGDPTIADGLAIARSKLGNVLGYALIAATIGVVLRLIENRGGFIGNWIIGLAGMAFTSASFLTMPVLVSQDIGSFDALKESATLLKKSWSENLIGIVGVDVVFRFLYLLLGFSLIIGTLTAEKGAPMVILWMLLISAFLMLAATHAALQEVYAAALYRYATTGATDDHFLGTLLQSALKK